MSSALIPWLSRFSFALNDGVKMVYRSTKYFYLYKVTDKNANKFKVLAQYGVELYHDDIEEQSGDMSI